MKIFIEVKGENTEQQTLNLKQFLEAENIDGLELEIEREKPKAGEMGGGAIGTLTAILIGVAGPFSRMAQAFTKYASSFRTEIILKNEFGDELVLNTKKVDRDDINLLVEKFLDKKKVTTRGKSK